MNALSHFFSPAVAILLSCCLLQSCNAQEKNAQTSPYQVTAKTVDAPFAKPSDDADKPTFPYVPITEWKPGSAFLMLPGYPGSQNVLRPVGKSLGFGESLSRATFAYKTFVLKNIEQREKLNTYGSQDQTIIRFECEDQLYEAVLVGNRDKLKRDNATIPGLTSIAELDRARKWLTGKTVYTLKEQWQRQTSDGKIEGLQPDAKAFVAVTVTKVGAGRDNDAPLRIVFKEKNGPEAFMDVFLSGTNHSMPTTTLQRFDKMFSLTDPVEKRQEADVRENPQIGKLKIGLTPAECLRLIGKPSEVSTHVRKDVKHEYWEYGWGMFLHFKNGLLVEYSELRGGIIWIGLED